MLRGAKWGRIAPQSALRQPVGRMCGGPRPFARAVGGCAGAVRWERLPRDFGAGRAAGWRRASIFLLARRQPCRSRRRRLWVGTGCPQKRSVLRMGGRKTCSRPQNRAVLRISGGKTGGRPQIGPVLRIGGGGRGSRCTKRGVFAHGTGDSPGGAKKMCKFAVQSQQPWK